MRTKGELKVLDSGVGTITCIKAGDVHIAQIAYCDYRTKEEGSKCYELQQANARHLVACWNALGPGGLVAEMAGVLEELRELMLGEPLIYSKIQAVLTKYKEIEDE